MCNVVNLLLHTLHLKSWTVVLLMFIWTFGSVTSVIQGQMSVILGFNLLNMGPNGYFSVVNTFAKLVTKGCFLFEVVYISSRECSFVLKCFAHSRNQFGPTLHLAMPPI